MKERTIIMASKTVIVGSAVGLHARPASIIADAAGEYDEDIFLSKVGEEDDERAIRLWLPPITPRQWKRLPV